MSAAARIALLSPLVIDQIAAGEVVERPASVVKELVDNAIDAGSTRVDVELEEGGLALIAVRDNGRGIHPDDLLLAVTRHATSKLRDPSELSDIGTLGFRGEALASIAAVARLDLRSRQAGAAVGNHLHARPGEPPRMVPAGLPMGTQVEVRGLFANLPARRKFMRAEATEVGQCSEILLRLAIVHPEVHVTLRHGKRELLNLSRGTLDQRVAQVLGRRVAGPLFAFAGEEDDTRVQVWLPSPDAAGRGRGGPYLVVRKRVVRERSLAQIVAQAYGLAGEASACVIVDPPHASVDVNVHPQKSEIRFSDPQRVYAAVRRVLAAAMSAGPWAGVSARAETEVEPALRPSGGPRPFAEMATPVTPAWPGEAERRPAERSPPAEFVQSAPPPRLIGPVGGGEPGSRKPRLVDREHGRLAEGTGPEGRDGQRDEGAVTGLDGRRGNGVVTGLDGRREAIARDGGLAEGTGAGGRDDRADDAWRDGLAEGTGRGGALATGATGPASAGAELAPGTGRGGYRLSTRALAPDYGQHKRGVMAEAAALRPASEPPTASQSNQAQRPDYLDRPDRPDRPDRWPGERASGRGDTRELLALRGVGHGPPALFSPDQIAAPVVEDIDDMQAPGDRGVTAREAVPQLLTCLPGPVALFVERDALLAIDLRRLRSHLVYLRLQRDLIGKRVVAVQGLLAPAVVRRPVEEVALLVAARAELLTLGVDLDGFGGDAVVVRGVPAHLRHCVDDADVADLIARIVPWLRMRTRETDASAVERGLLGAIAATRGADPAPRLARRWLAELLDAGATLTEVPGLRRWTPAALLGETAGVPRRAIALGHDDGAPV